MNPAPTDIEARLQEVERELAEQRELVRRLVASMPAPMPDRSRKRYAMSGPVGNFVVWGCSPSTRERLSVVAAHLELPKVPHRAGDDVFLVTSMSPSTLCLHLDPSDRTPQHFSEMLRNKANRTHHKGYRGELHAPDPLAAPPPVATPVPGQAVTALARVVPGGLAESCPDPRRLHQGPADALVALAVAPAP